MHQPDWRRESRTIRRRARRRGLARPAVAVVIALLVWFGAPMAAHAQVDQVMDGNMTEPDWHLLGTNEGGPAQQDPFDAQDALTALYAKIDANHFYIGVAGNVEPGNRILVFIDSRAGGFTDGSFGRDQAPPGIRDFRRDIRFDEGFTPDYVLVIGAQDIVPRVHQWDLYRLSTTGGPNFPLTNQANLGADPHTSDRTRGFEARFTYDAAETGANLIIDQPYVRLMAAYIDDDGFLSNQFISTANPGDVNYGDRQVFFDLAAPGPFTFAHFFVINEIDYIQPGIDDAEFIELKNITHLNLPLEGFSLNLARIGDIPYLQLGLPPGDIVPAGGYYVICANSPNVPNCNHDVGVEIGRRNDLLENTGPAGVALLYNGAVVDAVSYDGVMPLPYNESGSAAPAEPGDAPALGLSRYPDGMDTNRNSVDFSLRCITPGQTNLEQDENCTDEPTATPPTETPPAHTPTPTGTVVPPPMNGCRDILVNGDFESSAAWRFGNSPVPGKYTSVERRSGQRSVQLGNPDGGSPHVETYSSVRQQVTIPKFATTVQLRWWHFYRSEQPSTDHVSNQHNRQEVIALTPGGQTIKVLQRVRRNDSGWHESVLDLSEFAGKSFVLYFNVYNTGKGGRTWMFLDDVELIVCVPEGQHPPYPDKGHPPKKHTPIPTSTPAPTMSPTPTETPTETPRTSVPSIVLNPDEGPAGQRVNVIGMGFPANSQVNILLARYETGGVGADAGGRYASTFTDSEGRFEVPFEMPAMWPEGDDIVAGPLFVVAATNDLAAQARAIFEFLVPPPPPPPPDPSISLIPRLGGEGTVVTVRGIGFPANEQVSILLAPFGTGGNIADWDRQTFVTTTSTGIFSVQFTMPGQWDDGEMIEDGTLMVMATTNDLEHRARALFEFMTEPDPPDPPTPNIVLVPFEGGEGTQVYVRGTGFPANEQVNILLARFGVGGDDLSEWDRQISVTSNDNGNFSVPFIMPGQWDDGNPIMDGTLMVMATTNDLEHRARALFEFITEPDPPDPLTPSILLIPFEGGPGTRVIVEGTGFPANTPVDILLAPFGIGGADLDDWDFQIATTTNDEGNFMVRFVMPAMWEGDIDILDGTLMVMAITADREYRARALFEFMAEPGPPDPPEPSISLDPDTGTQNTAVTVTGMDFPPGATVNIHLARIESGGGTGAEEMIYGTDEVDADGTFELRFRMPGTWPDDDQPIPTGRLYVVAATDDFSAYANAEFGYIAPSARAPDLDLAPSALAPAPCIELVNNGDFEQVGVGWNLSEGDIMPMYVTDNTFNDSAYAARLGLVDEPNQPGVSAIDQVIQLPAQADSILLSFRYYPLYEEPAGPGDLQYVDIYNAQTGQFAGRALGDQLDDRMWLARNYDLTALAGQSVRLVFAVNNDGVAGRIAMYVDRVSVLACDMLEAEPENGEPDNQSSRQIFQNPARPQAASLQPVGSDGLGGSGWQMGGALIVLALTGVFGLVAPAIRRAMRGRDG